MLTNDRQIQHSNSSLQQTCYPEFYFNGIVHVICHDHTSTSNSTFFTRITTPPGRLEREKLQ